MGARLLIESPRSDAFEVTIGNTATIGRTHENTVCLSFSPLVSRQHAIIRCQNGFQYHLIDLGSRNGTYLNDQRVIMPISLSDGSRIRIADNTITFFISADDQAADRAEPTITDASAAGEIAIRRAALLVCDIRGFSTIAERLEASEVARTLGIWFRDTANLVSRSGGIIDKFIGDAILAYWHGNDTADDCRAAFRIAREMIELAAARTWPNRTPFRVAAALHHGEVTCSAFGPVGERDMTVIGDAVNTVFRLETVAKELNQSLVLSGAFYAHVAALGTFVAFGAQSLKGKARPVTVFALQIR